MNHVGYFLHSLTVTSSRASAEPFQCKWKDCRSTQSFGRLNVLWRHIETQHLFPGAYKCHREGCGRSFNRKDNLGEHALRVHGERRVWVQTMLDFARESWQFRSLGLINNYHLGDLGVNRARWEEGDHFLLAKQYHSKDINPRHFREMTIQIGK